MTDLVNRAYDDIVIGDQASMTKVITDEDVQKFADVSMDRNPIHLDDDFASGTMFKKRIAHGIISAGLISAVIGTKLPGINTIYLGQDLKFVAPVFLGDELTAYVEVIDKRDDKHIIKLKTTVKNQDGKDVTTGEAIVLKK